LSESDNTINGYVEELKKKAEPSKTRSKAPLIILLIILILGILAGGTFYLWYYNLWFFDDNSFNANVVNEPVKSQDEEKYYDFIAFQIKTGKVDIEEVSEFFPQDESKIIRRRAGIVDFSDPNLEA